MNLEELIGQHFTLIGNGRYIRAVEHDSLIIDRDKQIFFWNSKGIIGDAYKWLTSIRGYPHEEAIKLIGNKKNNIFNRSIIRNETNGVVVNDALVEAFYEYGKQYRQYWHDVRGYIDETVERFRLGYAGDGWYTIPIFVDGIFRNFQCRNAKKRMKPWYLGTGALPFNFGILAVTDWVVLTEGPVDAIMLRQNDIPAVSQTAGAGSRNTYRKHFVEFKDIKKLYICYDNDEAGNTESLEVAKLFGEKAKIYNMWGFEEKFDVTNFFKSGKTRDEFMNLLETKGKSHYEIR